MKRLNRRLKLNEWIIIICGLITLSTVITSIYLAISMNVVKAERDEKAEGYDSIQEELKLKEQEIAKLKQHKIDVNESMAKLDIQIEQMHSEIERIEMDLEYHRQLRINEKDVTIRSNISVSDLNSILENTGLEGLGQAYVDAEREYGINALYMYALTALESAFGNSRLARERNNVTSFMAYDHDVNKARYFESKYECIMVTAEMLARDYLSEDGKYYNGLSLKDINKAYASDYMWHSKIESIAIKAFNKVK